MSKATHEVVHKRFYLAVKGKMQHMPVGTPLTLTAKQAEKMGARVKPIGGGETVDLTVDPDAELKALRAKAKELGVENASKMKADTLKAAIEKIEAEAAKLGG